MQNPSRIQLDDIVIRPAGESDAEAVGLLWEQLVRYHYSLDDRLPMASKDGAQRYARRVINRIADTHTHIVVAEHNGQIIGFSLGVIVDMVPEMFVPDTGGFLADIFVDNSYRRTGIGRKLVESIADWLRSRGVQHMEWYVAAQNIDGRTFWEMLGGRDIMIRMRMQL